MPNIAEFGLLARDYFHAEALEHDQKRYTDGEEST
jgi:hypothetical protein